MSELVIENAPERTIGARARRFGALLVPSFEDIRRLKPVLPPLAAGWLFALAGALGSRPLVLGAIRGEQPGAAATMELMLWFAVLAAPLVMLAKASLLTALGWAVLVLANLAPRLRLIFSVLLYGEAILMFQGVAVALLVHLTTGGNVTSAQDLQIPLGLSALVTPATPVLWAAAQSVTVFHLGWALFVAAALRRCVGLGGPASGLLALFFWGALLALTAARTYIAL